MPPRSLLDLNRYLGLVDPNKPPQIRRLKAVDKQILILHCQGIPVQEICEQLPVSPSKVRTVINSDLGQQAIDDFMRFQDAEFAALHQLSISAIRDALLHENIDIRLKAADKYLKAHGKYERGDFKETTAEDVIRRIMEIKITEERPANAGRKLNAIKGGKLLPFDLDEDEGD